MRKDDEVMNQFQGLTADDLAGFEAKCIWTVRSAARLRMYFINIR